MKNNRMYKLITDILISYPKLIKSIFCYYLKNYKRKRKYAMIIKNICQQKNRHMPNERLLWVSEWCYLTILNKTIYKLIGKMNMKSLTRDKILSLLKMAIKKSPITSFKEIQKLMNLSRDGQNLLVNSKKEKELNLSQP